MITDQKEQDDNPCESVLIRGKGWNLSRGRNPSCPVQPASATLPAMAKFFRALAIVALAAALAAQTSREARFETRLENEQIEVYWLDLPARAHARVFQNTHDVIWIALNDGEATFSRSLHDDVHSAFRSGDVRLFTSFQVETVTNPGDTPLHAAVVQFKRRGLVSSGCGCSGEAERAVCGCAGAAHLPSLWALAVGQLTLAGTRLDAGQAFASSARRDDMLLVAVTPLQMRDISAADTENAGDVRLAPGEAVWLKAGRHRFQNTGDSALRFVTIEF